MYKSIFYLCYESSETTVDLNKLSVFGNKDSLRLITDILLPFGTCIPAKYDSSVFNISWVKSNRKLKKYQTLFNQGI